MTPTVVVLVGLCVVFCFLFLVILAALREIVIMRGDLRAFEELITAPPPPRVVNSRLDDATSHRLGVSRNASSVLAFVSDSCEGCSVLLRDLETATMLSGDTYPGLVVIASRDSNDFRSQARRIGAHFVEDGDLDLFDAFQVRSTPTLFELSGDGSDQAVVDYTVGGSYKWISSRLKEDAFSTEQDTRMTP